MCNSSCIYGVYRVAGFACVNSGSHHYIPNLQDEEEARSRYKNQQKSHKRVSDSAQIQTKGMPLQNGFYVTSFPYTKWSNDIGLLEGASLYLVILVITLNFEN